MDKVTFLKLLRRVVLIPLGAAMLLALVLILEVRTLARHAQWVEHSDQVIAVTEQLYRSAIDEETGVRAYLLTRDEKFLQPYHQALGETRVLDQQLRQLISDDPEQQARDDKAVRLREQWESFANQAMAMAKIGGNVSSPDFELKGKELMDRYRQARSEFIDQERQIREQSEAQAQRTLRIVNASVVGLCFLVGAMLAATGRRQVIELSTAFGGAIDKAEANASEARAQKEWSHTILRSIGDAVIATDVDGCVTFMNPVAEGLTGWSLPEARSKPLTEIFRIVNERTRETVENPVDKVRRLNTIVGLANHTILISKTGQEFSIDDSGSPIRDENGAMAGIVLIFRDITQQRSLEAALRSNERLAVAGRLSASIAHEILNPLDTASNLLYLATQRTNGEAQQLVGTAQREVHRVAQISKNMLSLHRESRAPSPIQLSELLDGVVTLIDETLAKSRRRIRVEHGFEGQIEGFPAELRQVFTNVIKNAVEATSDGGSIRIFSVPAEEDGRNGVLVHISDNGVGIPEQMKSKLFTPFATTKEESGSGLGLWVSRSIVERHEGSMRVSSGAESGHAGTTVSIFLPLRVANAAEGEARMQQVKTA